MTVRDKIRKRVSRAKRVPRIDKALSRTLGEFGPLHYLSMLSAEAADIVAAYRVAREGAVVSGSSIMVDAYQRHLKSVIELLPKLSPDIRKAALREIHAHHQFIEDAGLLSKLITMAETIPPSKLSRFNQEVLADFTKRITDDVDRPVLRQSLEKLLRAIPPGDEQAWTAIVDLVADRVRRARQEHPGLLAKRPLTEEADKLVKSYANHGKGEIFEWFVRRTEQMADAFDREMRMASLMAAKMGEGWRPLKTAGELKLAVIGDELFRLIQETRTPLTPRALHGKWQQYADSGVLAVSDLADGPQQIGKAKLSSLFQMKAEAGTSELPHQALKDIERALEGAKGKTVLVRFTTVGEDGVTRDVMYSLIPPDPGESLRFYALATSETRIGDQPGLRGLGVDYERRRLGLSNREARDLFEELFWTILEKL